MKSWPVLALLLALGAASSPGQEPSGEEEQSESPQPEPAAVSARQATEQAESERPSPFDAMPAAGAAYREELSRLEALAEPAPQDWLRRFELLRRLGRQRQVLELTADLAPLGLPAAPLARARAARAQALLATGDVDGAEAVFRELAGERGGVALNSVVELGRLAERRGERAAAHASWFRLIDVYNQRATLQSDELVAVGRACRLLGVTNPDLYKDALKAFDEALAADPDQIEARWRMGALFVEKYDSGQARPVLEEAAVIDPDHPEVLHSLALLRHFDGDPSTRPIVDRLLELDPGSVPGLVFKTRLLLELEKHQEAEQVARAALEVNAQSLEARSVLAAALFLQGKSESFAEQETWVLGASPLYADFYNQLAETSVQNRLYVEARDFALRAVEIDALSWRGLSLLGMNRLRLGQMEQGRADLEKAFAADPFNVWNKNTLDLLDKLDGFEQTAFEEHGARFEVVVDSKDAALLIPYVRHVASQAYATLQRRYQFQPDLPIRIEVYSDHQDFSVRTVGLEGLGALGVSFGSLVAMDSPSARGAGDFNWGTTLWHELAHTFTLGVTKNRIPRWLTEGLSVHEERQSPYTGWGDDVQPTFVQLLADGELLGLREINAGFVRPKFPNQIALSYFQASLIAQWIETNRGWDSMLQILAGYADGKTTEQVFEVVLGMTLEEFDEVFFGWLRERYAGAIPGFRTAANAAVAEAPSTLAELVGMATGEGEEAEERAQQEGESERGEEEQPRLMARLDPSRTSALAGDREAARLWAESEPGNVRAQMQWGQLLLEDGRLAEAEVFLQRGRDLFPEFAGPGSGYHALVDLYDKRSDSEMLRAELRKIVDINEFSYREHVRFAELLREAGVQPEVELDVLERLNWIYPLGLAHHERLANLARDAERWDLAVREQRAFIALGPPSLPQARFDLAKLLLESGRREEARLEVLGALEIAPDFPAAQELLLQLLEISGEAEEAASDVRVPQPSRSPQLGWWQAAGLPNSQASASTAMASGELP